MGVEQGVGMRERGAGRESLRRRGEGKVVAKLTVQTQSVSGDIRGLGLDGRRGLPPSPRNNCYAHLH